MKTRAPAKLYRISNPGTRTCRLVRIAAANPRAAGVRYVRFGLPPESGFSVNRRDNTREAGVSTHRLLKHKGKWFLDDAGVGYTTLADTRPQYELSGDLVGYGSDGEPLLGNVKVLGRYRGTRLADLPSVSEIRILEGTARLPVSAVARNVITGKIRFVTDPWFADGALTESMEPRDLIAGIRRHWRARRNEAGAVRAERIVQMIESL